MRELVRDVPQSGGRPSLLDRIGDSFDRAVYALSPVRGARRMAARARHRAIEDYVCERGLKLRHPAMRFVVVLGVQSPR